MEKITVTMLSHRSAYLRRALEAVSAQTYKNIEIIVRDNCSPENVKEVVNEYSKIDSRVKYICNEENIFEMESWLEAIKACDTKYILVPHDDDIMEPELIEREAAILDAHEDVVMVACACRIIDANSFVMREDIIQMNEKYLNKLDDISFIVKRDGELYDFHFEQNKYLKFLAATGDNTISSPTVLYRTDAVKRAIADNRFKDFDRHRGSDVLRSLILNEVGSIYIINEMLYNYRINSGQLSSYVDVEAAYSCWKAFDDFCTSRLGAQTALSINQWYYMSCEIAYKLQDCNIIELKKNILETIDSLDIINALLDDFLVRVKYLQAVTQHGQIKRNYVIWGAGGAGIVTKKILDVLTPSLCFMGFIDSYKEGPLGPHSVTKPGDYDFGSDALLVVSVSEHFKSILGILHSKGLKRLDDYILGYGCYASIVSMGIKRNPALEYERK